jgi:hypothetical protein
MRVARTLAPAPQVERSRRAARRAANTSNSRQCRSAPTSGGCTQVTGPWGAAVGGSGRASVGTIPGPAVIRVRPPRPGGLGEARAGRPESERADAGASPTVTPLRGHPSDHRMSRAPRRGARCSAEDPPPPRGYPGKTATSPADATNNSPPDAPRTATDATRTPHPQDDTPDSDPAHQSDASAAAHTAGCVSSSAYSAPLTRHRSDPIPSEPSPPAHPPPIPHTTPCT